MRDPGSPRQQVPEAISQDRIRLTERPSDKLAPHPHSTLSLSTNAPWSDILSVTSIFATLLPNTHALEPDNLSLVRNDPHARTSSPRGGTGACRSGLRRSTEIINQYVDADQQHPEWE